MGEVFLALDTVLRRRVAIKILSVLHALDPSADKRLLQEARAAAALDHPNICAVYAVGQDAGRTFIAMQWVEGEPLSAHIKRGPLGLADALKITIQVAEALREAHAHGVVHRDLKPGNVMLDARGDAKLLDFGLATLRDDPLVASEAETRSRLTNPGAISGTLAYMSPEQARGLTLDGRTDLFSLGILLYELLTGRRPFDGDTAADRLSALLTAPAAPLSRYMKEAPAELQRIVSKALTKDRDQRYPSATDLLGDLRAFETSSAAGAVIVERTAVTRVAPAPGPVALAVLPFDDMSPGQDQAFFCEGMAEEVINAVAHIEGLRVASRSSAFEARRKTKDLREVGATLRVDVVLEGSVRQSGSRLRVTARLVNVADGLERWSERYEREMRDVFEIQDEIACAIASALKIHVAGETEHPLMRRATESLEAYQLYLKGVYHWNRRLPESLRAALELFEQALAADPGYAPAYAAIAACHIAPGYYGAAPPQAVMPLGKAAAERALALDPSVSDAHAILGMVTAVFDYEWLRAEDHFQRAIALNPSSSTALMWYALFHLTPLGRLDEALVIARRGEQNDPLNPAPSAVVGAVLYNRREYAAALAQLERPLALQPRYPIAHVYAGKAAAAIGRFDRAAASLETARSLLGGGSLVLGTLVACHAAQGDRRRAEATMDELQALATKTYVPAYSFAEAFIALGEHEKAFEWLGRAREERSALPLFLLSDRVYDPLREDPRFGALVSRFNL
jgi:TolB-like protein/Tfp pilus assembly protein PilF/predicted Ser/Thr protein kinase